MNAKSKKMKSGLTAVAVYITTVLTAAVTLTAYSNFA